MKSQSQPSDPNRLIASDPIERLLATMEVEIRVRVRRFTQPHVSLELELLRSFKADLEEALRDARAADVIGNVKDAARVSKRPESTVRRICYKHGERAGATMVEGEYSIHLPTFVRFMANLPQRHSGAAADDRDLRITGAGSGLIDNQVPDDTLEEAA